ncbi:MAG: HAD-IC family P-type ATPase, partial [Planctomycetes bacterium]|nr:HAD-IC family P-type ATPase [Planctomycetota bacterium]
GPGTEIGRIAALAESAQEPPTPLERRIAGFGRVVVWVALTIFAAVMAVGLARGVPPAAIFMIATSQMVSLVPEGLPVAVTIALAVGVQRMARRRAIVRRLVAVETLGSTTVICSDKTGTLTRNEMTVTAAQAPGGPPIEVTGSGYGPVGRLVAAGRELTAANDPATRALAETAALCNDAQVTRDETRDLWQALGDPTEAALLTFAAKAGIAASELRARCPRRAELPFDPDARLMATQHDGPEGGFVAIKGAPEAVLALCAHERRGAEIVPLTAAGRAAARAAAEGLAAQALRALAVARAEGVTLDGRTGFAALAGRATWLGLVGEMDPPRPEVAAAVRDCMRAGIRPVMVTGDHRATGMAVARLLGIARPGDAALEGSELAALTDEELGRRLEQVAVFARVHPAQKLRIVAAYQRRGEVVAMTGDGVNDAPALARADVGVAMGLAGTEVAKEAARIVLTDDNFATLVAAVEEGRLVARNIQKVIVLMLSTSAAEVAVLVTALVAGYPPPFAAVQILWNNVVTEGVITVNLVLDERQGDEMQVRPVPPDQPLVTRSSYGRVVLMTAAIVVSTLGWFAGRLAYGVPFPQVQSETFTLLAVCEWFNVLNSRSAVRSAFDRSAFSNPWLIGGLVLGNVLQAAVIFMPALNRVFHTVPIPPGEAIAIGVVASLVLWVEEGRKWRARRRERAAG